MNNKIKYNVKTITKLDVQNTEKIKKIFNEKLLKLIVAFENR